ncbi:MAG: hypothetical protein K8J31_11780, partial [Anaerolineae bacterium]|nr:hypothetical protein [Anaerolineae bacterium]
AQQREWDTLQDTLKRLLAQLEPLIALEVAAVRVQQHLPRFEVYYPEAGWVRQLLLTVISYASAPDHLPEQALTQFPSPGCGNYIRAVLDLARAVQTGTTPYERYSHITNAIANTTLAELMDGYYRQRPDEWERLNADADAVNRETGLTVRQELYGRFWMDDAVARRDTAIWLAVADAIAGRFNEVLK